MIIQLCLILLSHLASDLNPRPFFTQPNCLTVEWRGDLKGDSVVSPDFGLGSRETT